MPNSTLPDKGRRAPERQLQPELLDELSASDPAAIRSRRDLRRVNRVMGNARIVSRLLQSTFDTGRPKAIVEIGAGDGQFLLQVAEKMSRQMLRPTALLVDRQHLLAPTTSAKFQQLGWHVKAVEVDVFDWVRQAEPVDVIIANLFLHHFDNCRLKVLFQHLANRTSILLACEPRRFAFPGIAGILVRLIGCNAVTRHDAVASVRAGFIRSELTAAWPNAGSWKLGEGEAGLFSHWFTARRLP